MASVRLRMAARLRPALTRWRLSWWLPPLLLVLIWLAIGLLIQPYADFPLASSAAAGLQHPWASGLGLLFAFSPHGLRAGSALLGLVGVLALYQLAREAGLRPDRAFVVALLVGLNPFYLQLSYSVADTVLFTALAIAALWTAVRAIPLERAALFGLSIGLLVLAVIVQPISLVLPLGLAVGLAVYGDWWGRAAWRLWLPLVLCAAAALLSAAPNALTSTVALPVLVAHGGRAWLLWGLLLLPILLMRAPKRPDRAPRLTRLADVFAGMAFGAWAVAAVLQGHFLVAADLLGDFGLSLPVFYSATEAAAYGQLSAGGWTALAILGAAGGALVLRAVLYHLIAIGRHRRLMGSARVYWVDLLMVTVFVLYGLHPSPPTHADRQLVFALVPLLILLLRTTEPIAWAQRTWRTAATVAAYGPIIWFSVCAVHDSFAWRRAEASVRVELVEQGIPQGLIAPGPLMDDSTPLVPTESTFVLGLTPPEGSIAVGEQAWSQWLWLPPRTQRLRAWQRFTPVHVEAPVQVEAPR